MLSLSLADIAAHVSELKKDPMGPSHRGVDRWWAS